MRLTDVRAAEPTLLVPVVCYTTRCPRRDRIITTHQVDAKDADAFYEGWKPNGYTDSCPGCGHLGILEHPL